MPLQNARLLFRASLLHLPLWMAAFLLHRQPNTNDAKVALLWRNVRLLGLGALLGEEEEAARATLRTAARERLASPPPPPSPFLPLRGFHCPSKAIAEPAAEAAEAAEQQPPMPTKGHSCSGPPPP